MSHTQAGPNLDYRVGDQPVPGYKLVRELGRGAMGVVWLATTDSGFDRALKVINLRQRGGKKEYRGLRTIKQRKLLHGNLLTLIDYWLKDTDGQFIPDSDDFENTDSFFTPQGNQAGPLSLTQTTSQSVSATNADPRPTWQSVPLTSRGVTMIPTATRADTPSSPPPAEATSQESTDQPVKPERRPVQLIVAMEVGHKTLDDRQKQCQQDKLHGIPVKELLDYMEQAARGLDYLHREGIIHRDIKPHNIMLVGDVAKVCDYGLVVTTDADLRKTSNAFTPLYASPEAVGEQPLTGHTDQYSLAITYVELRTGKSPYTSETAASVYAAKETGKYNLSRIHKSCVRNVLRRALSRNPNERFTTCSEFVHELENAEHSHPFIFWAAATAAALAFLAIGTALAVPGIRDRLIPPRQQVTRNEGQRESPEAADRGATNDKTAQTTQPIEPTKRLAPPTPELRQIVDEARSLRLAGKLDEAAAKLAEAKIDAASTDPRHWAYRLECLSTEITAHQNAPDAKDDVRWDSWKQLAQQLAQQSHGEGADAVLLGVMHIFANTRFDPLQLTLDGSVSDFASVMSNSAHWEKVLREKDQTALKSLRDALRQRLVASDPPLTTEWKENLNSIWSDREALQILIDRVHRQLPANNAESLQSAAADLDELAGPFLRSASDLEPQIASVRAELQQHRQKTALAQLQPFLREDLASSAARSKLINLLGSLGEAANAPLARLLRIEADLEAADGRGSTEQRNKIRSVLLELDRSNNAADRSLADFARFLRTRIDIQLYPNRTPEDVKVLLAWPSSGQADWQTPARSLQAAGILLRLANASLPAEREGELALFGASSDQITTATGYLGKAAPLAEPSSAADGLKAIVTAVAAYQANDSSHWKEISELTTTALGNWNTAKDSPIAHRRPAVQVVAALAAARLKDHSATAANTTALATFADLLNRSFHENLPAEADDELLFSMVVTPALELLLDDSNATMRDRLAAIWIAKARLLERDDSYALVGPAAAGESKDGYARTILAANKAYESARQLSESVTSAAGFGRTLLKLSRGDFIAHHKQNSAILAALVERYDPQGNADNPSLRLASAWVSWDTAMQETARQQQLANVANSLRHYCFVVSATTERDPYALNSLALMSASNAHVRAAYWTPIGPRDVAMANDNANLADKDPSDMSKYDHLRRAVELAQAAELDEKRRLPEEAYMSEGNALEDLAYYCKLTDNYADATKAFENASQNTGLRSKVYAFLSLGRCQYRWSREPANTAMTRTQRVAKIREAFASLKAATDAAGPQDSRDLAEASWWLSQVCEETLFTGPGGIATNEKNSFESESFDKLLTAVNRKDSLSPQAGSELAGRLRNLEQAWKLVRQAMEIAATNAPQDEVTYRIDALEIGIEQAGYLKQIDSKPLEQFLPPNRRDELIAERLVELRKSATQFLELSQRDSAVAPRSLALRALDVLARANANVVALPEGKSNAPVVLKKWEGLFTDPDDQDKLVEVLLWETNYGEAEPLLVRAEDIAKQIKTDSLRNRALGRVFRTRADLALTNIDKALTAAKAAKAAGRPASQVNVNLKDVVEAYGKAEEHLARAKGDDVVANLAKLNKQQLVSLPARFEREMASNLELQRLREFVLETNLLRRDAAQATKGWLNLAGFESELTKPGPLPAAARPIVQRLHDFLKPRAVLRDGGLSPDDKLLIEAMEQKLAL